MSRPRIIIADDHRLLLEALQKLFEPHFDIVGTALDGQSLLQTALRLPDVIVVDLMMPELSGLEAGRQLTKLMPGVKVIYLTMNEDPEIARKAMQERASGYLLKSAAASELLRAVQIVFKGGSYVSPRIAKGMEEAFIRNPEVGNGENALTPRQREVIQLLAEGKSMKEAADILGLTPRTIAFHKYQVMERLGIKSSASLIQFAIKNHILVA